jgi:hypothetical protein
VPRRVVKAWITAALGKGSPVTKWATKAVKEEPELADHDPKVIGDIICARYSFLRRPGQAVAEVAGLDSLVHVGTSARLLTHRLMAIEAKALTGAMEYLHKAHGVLALPMHDGLLVPLPRLRWVEAGLVSAYSWAANGMRIRCKTTTAEDIACA